MLPRPTAGEAVGPGSGFRSGSIRHARCNRNTGSKRKSSGSTMTFFKSASKGKQLAMAGSVIVVLLATLGVGSTLMHSHAQSSEPSDDGSASESSTRVEVVHPHAGGM